MTNQTGIRPYGPGKFDTIMDSYVYKVSLDGADDEAGSVTENGVWYGMMRHGHTIFKNGDPSLEELTGAERDYLIHVAGAIICEDSQGFVSVEYFDQMADLDTAWRQIVADMEEEEEA